MFRFARPEILYVLFAIPVLLVVYMLIFRNKKNRLKAFGNYNTILPLMPDISFRRMYIKSIIFMLACIALILSMAGPQFGSKVEESKRKGIELMIVLDVSNSMLAEDIIPNRLERAKMAIIKLVDKLQDDKVGLIVFAGDAFIQVPVTTDYVSTKMFVSGIKPDIVPVQGTAIGKALTLAGQSMGPQSDVNKAVIVITDGENHEDDAISAAQELQKKNIIVHCIGLGSSQGAPIPVNTDMSNRMYMKDNKGDIVITTLDEMTLQQIALAGKGEYVRASNSEIGLNTIFNKITKMEKSEIKSIRYTEYEDRYRYLAGLALLLLIFDFCILERKNKILSKINLFK